ncbi:MAG: nuclear transport factor 2 family protein [Acidobacteriia bacterium]|nr:nuclear transport factor 2 family protein [Terriglobia bacterium]
MAKFYFALILLTALSLPVLAQDATLKADANPPAESEVKKAEADLAKLLVQADWDQYAARLSDDYVRTENNGDVKTKAEVLADLRSGKSKLLDVIPEELQVRLYGDTAILTGHLSALTRQNGRVTTVFSRITETFVKHNGSWFLAALQQTTVLK